MNLQTLTTKGAIALSKFVSDERVIKSSDFKTPELLKQFEEGLDELKLRGFEVSVSFGMGSIPFATYRISNPE